MKTSTSTYTGDTDNTNARSHRRFSALDAAHFFVRVGAHGSLLQKSQRLANEANRAASAGGRGDEYESRGVEGGKEKESKSGGFAYANAAERDDGIFDARCCEESGFPLGDDDFGDNRDVFPGDLGDLHSKRNATTKTSATTLTRMLRRFRSFFFAVGVIALVNAVLLAVSFLRTESTPKPNTAPSLEILQLALTDWVIFIDVYVVAFVGAWALLRLLLLWPLYNLSTSAVCCFGTSGSHTFYMVVESYSISLMWLFATFGALSVIAPHSFLALPFLKQLYSEPSAPGIMEHVLFAILWLVIAHWGKRILINLLEASATRDLSADVHRTLQEERFLAVMISLARSSLRTASADVRERQLPEIMHVQASTPASETTRLLHEPNGFFSRLELELLATQARSNHFAARLSNLPGRSRSSAAVIIRGLFRGNVLLDYETVVSLRSTRLETRSHTSDTPRNTGNTARPDVELNDVRPDTETAPFSTGRLASNADAELAAEQQRFIDPRRLARGMSKKNLQAILQIFDVDGDGILSTADIHKSVKRVYGFRKLTVKRMRSRFAIADITNIIANILLVIVFLCIILVTLGVDVTSLLVPLAGGLLGVSFAYGMTLQEIFDSLYMLYFLRPFDIGDIITTDAFMNTGQPLGLPDQLYVEQVGLLTTYCIHGDGYGVYLRNAKLCRSRLANMNRGSSAGVVVAIDFVLAFDVSAASVAELTDACRVYFVTHKDRWSSQFTLMCTGADTVNSAYLKLTLRATMKHQKWQNTGAWRQGRTELVMLIREITSRLNLNANMTNQQIDVRLIGSDNIVARHASE